MGMVRLRDGGWKMYMSGYQYHLYGVPSRETTLNLYSLDNQRCVSEAVFWLP